jgi:hypothetical protein
MSGLIQALDVVRNIEGIGFVYFDERDVVRHKLVQQIVKAYDAFSRMDNRAVEADLRSAFDGRCVKPPGRCPAWRVAPVVAPAAPAAP